MSGKRLAELGSRGPEQDLRQLLAFVDGLLTSQMVDPTPDFAPASALAALLHGLIDLPSCKPVDPKK